MAVNLTQSSEAAVVMKQNRRVTAGLLVMWALAAASPAEYQRAWERHSTPPEPINLDIPEEVVVTEAMLKERELALHALRDPKVFRELLLQLQPLRRLREQSAMLAILQPQAFRKGRLVTVEQSHAEAAAAHAILNPRIPPPFAENED
jgi:hypothetical protein